MQHIASPLQPEQTLDTPQAVIQGQQASSSSAQDVQNRVSLAEKHQFSQQRRVEGPDLSGAIERVLAWHRSRSRHH